MTKLCFVLRRAAQAKRLDCRRTDSRSLLYFDNESGQRSNITIITKKQKKPKTDRSDQIQFFMTCANFTITNDNGFIKTLQIFMQDALSHFGHENCRSATILDLLVSKLKTFLRPNQLFLPCLVDFLLAQYYGPVLKQHLYIRSQE